MGDLTGFKYGRMKISAPLPWRRPFKYRDQRIAWLESKIHWYTFPKTRKRIQKIIKRLNRPTIQERLSQEIGEGMVALNAELGRQIWGDQLGDHKQE